MKILKSEIKKILDTKDLLSFVLIEVPSKIQTLDKKLFKSNFYDQRISQITYLPTKHSENSLDQQIFDMLHSKTRNMVRRVNRVSK